MTMPSKIWASEDASGAKDEWKMAMWHGHQNLIKPVRTTYIRADIAEELARALEMLLAGYYSYEVDAQSALARYSEAVGDK